jgi:hypothetical protein
LTIITNKINFLSRVIKSNHADNNNKGVVAHTLKLSTIYIPSSIKTVRLNISLSSGSRIKAGKSFDKILIKQSYIMLVWLHYLSSFSSTKNSNPSYNIPSFFIYPCRRQSFTLIKSPMAHKTFSQEQFLYKKYQLSVSFSSQLTSSGGVGTLTVCSVGSSTFFLDFILRSMPYISTNLFLIQRYTVIYYSTDPTFFNLFKGLSQN